MHIIPSKVIFMAFSRYSFTFCKQPLIVFESSVREYIYFGFMQNTYICLAFPQVRQILWYITHNSVHFVVQPTFVRVSFWEDTMLNILIYLLWGITRKAVTVEIRLWRRCREGNITGQVGWSCLGAETPYHSRFHKCVWSQLQIP